MASISKGREVQRDDLEVIQLIGDFLYFLTGIQPHAQAAIAGLKRGAVLDPQAQRHDQVVAVGNAVQSGVLGQ